MKELKKMVAYKDFGGHQSRYVLFYKKGYFADQYKFFDCYLDDLDNRYGLKYRLDGNTKTIFKDLDCLGLSLCDSFDSYDDITGRMAPIITARDNYTDEIIEEDEFINGFKRVRFKNGEFGFIREIDNKIMPYRFDVCSNFNKYNLALVGKNQKINYIDKDFNVFKYDTKNTKRSNLSFKEYEEELFPLKKTLISNNMPGVEQMSVFLEGDKPFALFGDLYKSYVVPITPDGEIASFKNYYRPDEEETIIKRSMNNVEIVNNTCILYDDWNGNNPAIYLPNGISFTSFDIFRFAYESGLFDVIQEKSLKEYDTSNNKYNEDTKKAYRENDIKYITLASNEIVTVSELVKRIVNLDEFRKYLNIYSDNKIIIKNKFSS